MYVNDLIDCLYYSIENFLKMPEVMNVGMGKDYSVLDYYKIVAKVLLKENLILICQSQLVKTKISFYRKT